MSEFCKNNHDLKLSTVDRVLPNVYYCVKCPLVLVPTIILLETFSAIREHLAETSEAFEEAEKDYKEFLEKNGTKSN